MTAIGTTAAQTNALCRINMPGPVDLAPVSRDVILQSFHHIAQQGRLAG